jgi:hypothetical protein
MTYICLPEFVVAYTPDPVVEEVVPATVGAPSPSSEARPVRRSCRMAAALVRANNASAAANNNNDLAPKDLNSRHLLSQNHSKKVRGTPKYCISLKLIIFF